jgi:hypothetical protein
MCRMVTVKRTLEDLWQEISPLLDEALDLPSSARESWLEDLEARTPELAAHVRSCLLRVAELADRKFLEAPVRFHLTAGLEGDAFGAYTLDRPLGFGGMGTVWLAHRSDGRFQGQVAVKLRPLRRTCNIISCSSLSLRGHGRLGTSPRSSCRGIG